MTIRINAQGAERKRLVQAIAKWLDCKAEYLGAPSFSYKVDYFTIEKDGTLISRAESWTPEKKETARLHGKRRHIKK